MWAYKGQPHGGKHSTTDLENMQNKALEGFLLSTQQERLWFLHCGGQWPDAGRPPYRCSCTVAIGGELRVSTLYACLRQVVERHEILRTTFQQLPGMKLPLQVVAEEASLAFSILDLSRCPCGELEPLFAELDRRPVDLRNGPPLCGWLLILAPERHLLYLDLPALCADAASLKCLARELSLCYDAREDGGEPPMEPDAQYADIAEWQKELLASEDCVLGAEYWRNHGFSRHLNIRLPLEREKIGPPRFEPRKVSLTVGAGLASGVDVLAHRCEVSPSRVLLSCWLALMGRLTGESATLVGVACDGRKYEELEAALGPFARYLPLRITSVHSPINVSTIIKKASVATAR